MRPSARRRVHPVEWRIHRIRIRTAYTRRYNLFMDTLQAQPTDPRTGARIFRRRRLASPFLGRRWLVVVLLCFVVSTEILFTPTTYDGWTAKQIFDAWLEQFLDALCMGISMMLAVTLADNFIVEGSWWQLPALVLATALSGALMYAALTVYHFPAGYYPPMMGLAGDALRPIFLGSLVAIVWAVQRRNARAARRLQRMELDRVALNRRMLEAQLQVMEAQIEPHFLFNTLATVKRLYQTRSQSGERMLDSLQIYLRSALPRMRGEKSTLGGECALVAAYLDVLQIRMGERLRFGVELPAALADIEFPPMMLITLIENAIKHGLNPAADGGRIDISARVKDGMLEVGVADTGVGFQTSSGSGIGLANIRSRLTALYGGQARLTLESNAPTGVVSMISVPHA
jgi:signal transduction histidine kinase